MNGHRDQRPAMSIGDRRNNRIETQIHRRRKAKASGPMESEWDMSQHQPPGQLRMVSALTQVRNRDVSAPIFSSSSFSKSVPGSGDFWRIPVQTQ